MTSAERHEQLEPLTRRNKAGELYRRLEVVEIQIHAALGLDPVALYARAKISDRTAADYLENECLAYLVRDAFLRGDHERFSTLASILLRRCVPWLRAALVQLGVQEERDLDQLSYKLVSGMITDLTSDDGRGDFFQVRFGAALKKDLWNLAEHYKRSVRRARRHVSLSDPVGTEGEGDDESAIVRTDVIPSREDVGGSIEARIDMAKALASIHDPRHRQAWIMYNDGWQIAAKDPAEPTISKKFGVTDRTVRLWLRQAEAELKAWYEAHG
jgi:hypothetical protein